MQVTSVDTTVLLSHPLIELPLTLNAIVPLTLVLALNVIELPSEIRGIDSSVTPTTVMAVTPEKVALFEAE